MPQQVIELLKKEHDRKDFSCGMEALDRYLQEQVSQDMKRGVATSFVLIEPPEKKVIGYYTLAAGSVSLDEWREAMGKKLPRYERTPVTLLGRLALDEKHQGRGLGELLLMDALSRSLKASHEIASVAMIVEAVNDSAKDFYQHYGFIVFPNQSHRLFLNMRTINDMFL
ncbi:MAG: GNAT family N-acetyltransferase [Nitrospiria bacterium]